MNLLGRRLNHFVALAAGWALLSSPGVAQVPHDLAAVDALIVQDESGGQNIPNYRYDRHHTAGGKGQITDETWLRVAPTLDIDVSKFTKAGMASEFDQDRVRWKLLATEGVWPWACFKVQFLRHLYELNLVRMKFPAENSRQPSSAHQRHEKTPTVSASTVDVLPMQPTDPFSTESQNVGSSFLITNLGEK